MSVRLLSVVWDGFPGGGSDLLAMLALADWSDEDGRCWPSMAAIANKARLSRSQAQRVVHGLINAGHVSVVGNETGGAPGTTRQYRINVATLTGRTDATPTGRTHATGSVHATGRTGAQEGPHPCGETGRTHATQTVSEPSVNRHAKNPRRVISQPPDRSEPEGFASFWEQYPRKEAKAAAQKAWEKIKPEGQALSVLMAGLDRQKASEQWRKDGGQFIPHPATWLNQRRWADEWAPMPGPRPEVPDFAAGAI